MSAPVASTPLELMTVAACAGGGAVRLESRPRPRAGRGELLLRLRCAGLCGTDLFKLRAGSAAPGTVLGHEVVGVVEAVGEGAAGFAVGDRVAVPHHVSCGDCALCRRGAETLCPAFRENLLAPGGFSESLVVRERAVRLAACGVPDHLPDEAAVFLEPAACVLRGIRRSQVLENEPPVAAAILGAGSMGLLHLLVLKALSPALRVVLVDPLAERRSTALRLGADAAAAPGEAARQAADTVFDTVGGAAALEAAFDLSRDGGAIVLFAHAADCDEDNETAGFALNPFFRSERKLLATYSSALPEQREAWRLLVSGRLDPSPLVTHRLPLSRLADAIELARERRALKVLLAPDPAAGDLS